jgi:hypothetical protein
MDGGKDGLVMTMSKRTQRQIEKGERRAAEFNAAHPVGTQVRYYPLIGEGEFVETKTRSPAWSLGCGEPVVSLEGKSGGFSLDHLQIVGPEAAR